MLVTGRSGPENSEYDSFLLEKALTTTTFQSVTNFVFVADQISQTYDTTPLTNFKFTLQKNVRIFECGTTTSCGDHR